MKSICVWHPYHWMKWNWCSLDKNLMREKNANDLSASKSVWIWLNHNNAIFFWHTRKNQGVRVVTRSHSGQTLLFPKIPMWIPFEIPLRNSLLEFPLRNNQNSRKNIILDKCLIIIKCVKSLILLKEVLIRSLCVLFVPKKVFFLPRMGNF